MTKAWMCQRKHQWETPGQAAEDEAPVCPVCGGLARQMRVEGEKVGKVEDSTVWDPEGWKPFVGGGLTAPDLEDFAIEGELGRGGMGIVYKARQASTGQVVAVKVIRKDRLLHGEAVERFRREAQAASRLDHPNIVRVLDSDHSGDTHYLVMEYVAGITLEQLVERQGPVAIGQGCEYIRQAALGLQHAFEQRLVHRDIKPSNLMVTPPPRNQAGEPLGLVKILDMGVARMLHGFLGGESVSTLTQRGAVLGTPDYVAPEQLENPHLADIRADLYSLGCTLYFLLTGQVPFPGGSLLSKLDKQRWEAPTPIGQLRSEVSPAVEALVHQLMAKDPAERFANPVDLARALETLAGQGYVGEPGKKLHSVRCLKGHDGAIWAAAFSPDGRRILSGGKDRITRVWETASGELVDSYGPLHQEIRCLAFAPGGDRFAVGSGVSVRLMETATGQELRRFSGHSDVVRCVAWSADGKWLLTGGDDKSVRLWDAGSGRQRQRLAGHGGGITGLALTPDGQSAFSASRDQTVRCWDLNSGQERGCLAAGGGAVLSLALAPDGRLLVSAHFDTLLRLWDLASSHELRRLPGHKQMVTAAAFTADGTGVVSGGQDQTIRFWDVDSGREVASGAEHRAGVHAVACSPEWVLSAGGDGLILLWQLPG